MKFRLSTVFLLITTCAIILGSMAAHSRQREAHEIRLAEERLRSEQYRTDLQVAYAKEHLAKSSTRALLGNFIKEPANLPRIRNIPLPDHFGGSHLNGPPFQWQWRLFLPKPIEFELCWAVDGIPANHQTMPADGHTFRSQLSTDGVSTDVNNVQNIVPNVVDLQIPVELLMFFRVEKQDNRRVVTITFEVIHSETTFAVNATRQINTTYLPAPNLDWISDTRFLKPQEVPIGSGIAPIPIHNKMDSEFLLRENKVLLKVRTKKHVGPGPTDYEDIDGPAPGLMIWIQRRD